MRKNQHSDPYAVTGLLDMRANGAQAGGPLGADQQQWLREQSLSRLNRANMGATVAPVIVLHTLESSLGALVQDTLARKRVIIDRLVTKLGGRHG